MSLELPSQQIFSPSSIFRAYESSAREIDYGELGVPKTRFRCPVVGLRLLRCV